MDEKLNQYKKEYEKTQIPVDLDTMIRNEIKNDKENIPKKKRERLIMGYKRMGAAAAAFTIVFVGAVNMSGTVAMAMYKVPVLGDIAKVVTFREYNYSTDIVEVKVKVPNIENTGNPELEKRINEEIDKKMEQIVADGEKHAEDYKQAILETGGTEEDVHQIGVYADYEKKFCDGNVLSFIINRNETAASANTEVFYYNIDLKTGKDLKIVDFLGKDYKSIVDESVKRQIRERMAGDENQIFFGNEEDADMGIEGFAGIDENQTFYVNDEGNVVVAFAKYVIAPGYMGTPEFEIVLQSN